ncbi:MAG TPA: OmpA family protein [Archangium sp.]|uniref:OmpA family protein n=1 Tax=Archangium sp. TaxID=1872627 RepID=UPI002E308B77|nr:OmpA family protein [Archangium sp.]HEX5750979.1 OmpA family protein [Archangium sp.]
MGIWLAGLLLSGSAALAGEPRAFPAFELERLDLNAGAAGSLLVGTGELLPEGELRLSSTGHYQHQPLVFARGGERLEIVGNRVTTHLAAAWAPFRWFELGAQVPLVAFQRGDDLRAEGIAPRDGQGLGTPLLGARVALLSQLDGRPLDLALGLGVGLPLGSASLLARDEGVSYVPRVMVGRRFGWFRVALDAQMMARPLLETSVNAVYTQAPIGNELRFGAAVATVGRRLRWELDVRGSVPLVNQPNSVELLLGTRYLMNPSMEVFAMGGLGVGPAPGTPLFRVMVGTAFGGVTPSRLQGESSVNCAPDLPHKYEECPDMDEDGDGVRNASDLCPQVSGSLDRNGCPWRDTDNDGIEDSLDTCPGEPGEAEWKGCPMPDDDKDGVADEKDRCPEQPGLKDHEGCPKPDADKDGVEDDVDDCPKLAGPEERKGCPETDTDKDGVANRLDSCPNVAGLQENYGCPKHEMPLIILSRTRVELASRIFFEPGHSLLRGRSDAMLVLLAKVINEHPEFPLIVVGAHTDDRGSRESKLRLSQARAEAVRRFLIENGVAPERVAAKGYGDERPIDSNATAFGRENNRRVEIEIVWPE